MRSQADIIMSHIVPMQCVDIQPIPTNIDEVIKRYMDFKVMQGFKEIEAYRMLSKLYAGEIRKREIEMDLSYRVWSEEVMRKFDNEFANTYVNPFIDRR